MYICIKCGNSNPADARYCKKCNALLPKIGMDTMTSATRGYAEFDEEELKFSTSGFYKGLQQVLTLYSDKEMPVKVLIKGLEGACNELLPIIETEENAIRSFEEKSHLSDELKDLMSAASLDINEGLEMMLEVYENTIENLYRSGEISLKETLKSAREADDMIIRGKNAFLNIINHPAAEEFKEEKPLMEDLFYKKKTSMPDDLYGGDHISFDIL